MSEPGASAVLEVLNGFVLHADPNRQIVMTCSYRVPVPAGAPRRAKCTWRQGWGTGVVGLPIRLAMDAAVEHMAKEHGA